MAGIAMMTGPERIGDAIGREVDGLAGGAPLAGAGSAAEVTRRADGGAGLVHWRGTAVDELWLRAYVQRLVVAGLVEPFKRPGPGASDDDVERARVSNRARVGTWIDVLGGLPREALEEAQQHFERHGVPDGRWGYLRPSDVSHRARALAQRVIPAGQECEVHPDRWDHECRECKERRRAEASSAGAEVIARLRAELAQRRGGGADE